MYAFKIMELWKKLGMPKPKSEASKGKLSFVDNEVYSGVELPSMPFFVRLDGWCFHRIAKELRLKKPFDKSFSECMVKTASTFFKFFNPTLAYIFSDEINILFTKHTTFKRVEKIDSVFAGLASSTLLKELSKKKKIKRESCIAFDCRCIPIEKKDIIGYLIWRQSEAFRNCNNLYAYWLLQKKERLKPREAAKKVEGMKAKELRKLIDRYHGLKKIPGWHERGVLLYKKVYEKEGFDPIKKKKVKVKRLKVFDDWNLPMFAKNKNFLKEIIEKGFKEE